jgi:hypothetical protein
MQQIFLSQWFVTYVDEEDFKRCSQFKWSVLQPYPGKRYAQSVIEGKRVLMHRFILNAPADRQVDHEDGDGLNNQRYNIRLATPTQNQCNRAQPKWKKGNSSRFKGVHWYPNTGLWEVQICVSGRRIHLGYHSDELKAAAVYNEAAKLHHGEFAFQNVL